MDNDVYDAIAVQGDFGYTSNGNEQVAVEIKILSGDRKGMSLTWYGNFGDDVFGNDPPRTRTEWTLLDLKKLGWTGEDLARLPGLGSSAVRVKLEDSEYNGKPQTKIKRIYGGGGLALKNRMTDAAKNDLAARIAKSVKKVDAAPSDPFEFPPK